LAAALVLADASRGVGPRAAVASAPLSNAAPLLAELGREALDPTQPELRRLELVRALAPWATADVRGVLVSLLGDASVRLRAAAARALGWPGNREAVPALQARLEAPDEAPSVRAAAAEALGAIGDPSTRSALLAAARRPEPEVRGPALWALSLGALAHPADRTMLLGELAKDAGADPQLRADALRALAAVPEPHAAEVLAWVLVTGPRLVVAPPSPGATQQEILGLRWRQARDLRAWAAKGLGDRRERSAVPALLQAAEEPDDYFLRLLALGALVALEAPEALPVFLRRLEDPFPGVRATALGGLGRLGAREPPVVEAIVRRLGDEDTAVRAHAVMALAVLGDASVRAPLERLRQTEEDFGVQRAIEQALATLPR
jgi:HEAT repeat protein